MQRAVVCLCLCVSAILATPVFEDRLEKHDCLPHCQNLTRVELKAFHAKNCCMASDLVTVFDESPYEVSCQCIGIRNNG
ncbi:hypothetical protein PoB_007135000 [Plakobranchus ocellatus]|uniref:Uncharacterized protein n=1 Tax=Plakobranchus ocellatus TaxID=259542 RepID=A0AAV4DL18_9GAST|nr:hypothetical protein PoB_007135000 [Plakobranchus ocellatus]